MIDEDLTVWGRYSGDKEYLIHYYETGTSSSVKPDYSFIAVNGLRFTIEDGIGIPGFTVTDMSAWEPLDSGSPSRMGTIFYSP